MKKGKKDEKKVTAKGPILEQKKEEILVYEDGSVYHGEVPFLIYSPKHNGFSFVKD